MDKAKRLPIRIAQMGVLTRTVRDTANYYAAVERVAPAQGMPPVGLVEGPSADKFRIAAFVDTPTRSPIDPDIRQATEATVQRLADMGHEIRWIDVPAGQEETDDFLLYWAFTACVLEGLIAVSPGARVGRLEPWTRALAADARRNLFKIPAVIKRLRRYEAIYSDLFTDIDVLLCPTTAGPAPTIGVLTPDQDFQEKRKKLLQLLPFTPIQNVAGAPAISVPVGTTEAGLPIGVQLAGPVGAEARLLSLAFSLEQGA